MTQWKITFVIVIILFSMGLPLLLVGYVSAGEDAMAMILPGWILIVIAHVAIVAAAIGMGFGKRGTTSEQDPASKNWWEGQSE